MASLAHATIVDEARVSPPSFDPAPLIGTAEAIGRLIGGELYRKRSSARQQADSIRMMGRHFGDLLRFVPD